MASGRLVNWAEKRELKNRAKPPRAVRGVITPELSTEIVLDLTRGFALRVQNKPLVEAFGQRYALDGTIRRGTLHLIEDGKVIYPQVIDVTHGHLYPWKKFTGRAFSP